MAPVRRILSDSRTQLDAEALQRLVVRQHGVVSRRQLREVGLSNTMVARWLDTGRLHPLHRHVFALGHTALSLKGHLFAALLYAGAGAALSHTTAAWAWRLIETEPTRIHLTVPGRRRSLPEVRIHHSRRVEATEHNGLPVTTVSRTLLDLATVLSPRQLRRALAEADYRGLLDPGEIAAALKHGRPGSKGLRLALRSHMPALAATLSELEERFLEVCESAGLPMPEVNARVGGMRVDALWREERVVVELDGSAAHGGWAAIKRDRERELALRSLGFSVVRYTWEQVNRRVEHVVTDLRAVLRL
jgi:hypothetical protein